MFPMRAQYDGRKLDDEYVQTRAKWEPLYEVTQIKGDGETHPMLSPADEFADYGTWDKADIAGYKPKEDGMLPHEYARSALQIGLQQAHRTFDVKTYWSRIDVSWRRKHAPDRRTISEVRIGIEHDPRHAR